VKINILNENWLKTITSFQSHFRLNIIILKNKNVTFAFFFLSERENLVQEKQKIK